MSVNRLQAFIVLLVLALTCLRAQAQPAAPINPPMPDRELVIATREVPPFAMKQKDGTWRGISIDLWRRVADQLHLRYRFAEATTNPEIIEGVAKGSFDGAIAALTITSARAKMVDFTLPYYTAGLGVAVSTGEARWLSIFRALLSFGFFQAVGVLLGLAMCVGFLVWLLERRQTDHFSGGAKGLGTGFWWSASAMTQAGGGDQAPATLAGRVVAIGWMIASVVAVAVFTAGITSALTKRELQGVVQSANDLRHVRVGAITGSASMTYLDRERIPHRSFTNAYEAMGALQAGALDAFVYDKPLLTWIVLQDFSTTARVLDIILEHENYAIAFPKSSAPLSRAFDGPLLETVESDWWDDTLFKYLGKQQLD
jgi:ABC-type amino acid transport substrate-binding protein